MNSDWHPGRYLQFEAERTRPARDLLARVPCVDPSRVVDLGCGPGNSTELLVERFAAAEVVGSDTSPAMLESARSRLPNRQFELQDVATWQPKVAPDLIFANAVLHWVPDHAATVPRLFSLLAPGGVLAFQVPDNAEEPSHRLMRELASEPPWAAAMVQRRAPSPVLSSLDYYELLASQALELDIWRTVYHHPLPSAGAIVDWFQTTGLRPFLEPLNEPLRASYLREYERRIALAYPRLQDGWLLPFPRLFVVARRPAEPGA